MMLRQAVILILLLILPGNLGLTQIAPTPAVDVVSTALQTVVGEHQVLDVSLDEEGTLSVRYATREINEIGYRAEVIDLYRAIGLAVMAHDLAIDWVTLVPSIGGGAAIEQITTRAEHTTALAAGTILRSSFLRALEVVEMEHGDTPPGQV